MNESPRLTELASRLLAREVGEIQEAEAVAAVVVSVLATFLTNVSSLVGVLGSTGLFRRSLRLTNAQFPLYAAVLSDQQKAC